MEGWNVIECGFNTEDQTFNFGTRALGGNESLYEACTLASIKNSNVSDHRTDLTTKCLIKSNKLFYTIDKTLGVFANSNCLEIDLNIIFEEVIDVLYVTENAKYALVLLRNGTLQCLDVEEKAALLECKILNNVSNEEVFMDGYLDSFNSNTMIYIIITKNGDINRLEIKDLEGNCSYKNELIKQTHCSTKTVAFNYPYIFLNGSEMIVYNLETDEELDDEPLNIVKAVAYDTDMFLVLDSSGNLIQICARTLIRYVITTTSFIDFIFLQNKKGDQDGCLLVAVTGKNEIGITSVQAFESCSNFGNLIFSLDHTDDIHLIVPESIHDNYMYVTIIRKENVTKEFHVQVVCETVKEKHLERLIKRQKFDQAEKFAKIFNLDRTEILKGRAKAVTTKINCSEENVNDLLKILDGIEDVEFKLQCCFDMYQLCNDIENVGSLLQYAFHHVKLNSENKEVECLANKITEILSKFDMFMLIQRYNTGLVWDDFVECNMIKLLNDYLKAGNIEVAAIIYSRIDIKIILPDVEQILHVLDKLPQVYHKRFLYSFIPISLRHLPSSIAIFVKWLRLKVFDMERTDFADFPQNAITFTNDIIKMLVHDSVRMIFQTESMHNLYQESVEDLRMLTKAFNRLKFVLTTYKISVPLKEYLMDSRSLISVLLGLTLSDFNFNKFFDEFLYNFIIENKLHPDDVLLEEIQNLLCYEENYWVDTVSRYLQKMNLVERKLQAINEIASSAKVPWSQFVKDITATALEYDHPLVASILKAIKNEPRRTVLTKYNLHRYINSSDLDFWINHILHRNLETMIGDVLTISMTPKERQLATYMLFRNLIGKWRFEDALKVLYMIPTEDLSTLSMSVTNEIFINSKGYFKNIQNYQHVIPRIRRCYKESGCSHICEERLDYMCNAIISYFQLRETHDSVTLNDLLLADNRAVLCDTLINEAVNEIENSLNIDALETLLNRVSKCLNMPKDEVILKFVDKCNNASIINKCAEHYYLYEESAAQLCKMAGLIIKGISVSSVSNCTLAEMSINDLTICDFANTGDANTLASNVKLAQKLVIKATLKAGEADDWMYCELLYILRNFFGSIIEREKVTLNKTFINAATNITPSLRTFYSITDMLKLYVVCASLYKVPNTKYLSYFNGSDVNLAEESSKEMLIQIKTAVQHLLMEGHILTAYHLILFFLMGLSLGSKSDANVISVLRNILKRQCIPQLLEKVFCSNIINFQFAFSLLITIDLEQFISLINQYIALFKANPSKLNVIMQLVIKVFKYHDTTPGEEYIKLFLLSKWWLKIDNCQIRMKTFYVSSIEELLKLLLEHDHLKLEMMEEFCDDFQLDVQYCYNLSLQKLITTWKPDYEINDKSDSKSALVLKSTEDELYNKCEKVLALIKCKDALPKCIERFCSSINFYHYEAFLCVFKILSFLTNTVDYSQKQQLLVFLKTYSRVSKPTNLELEEWFTVFPGSQVIDPLSKWRLPFVQTFFTKDVWKIIRPEINLKTYTTWIHAMPLLYPFLNVDDICSFVVKDVVSSGTLGKSSSESWVLTPIHESLFHEIDCCVQYIQDIEKATSVVYHLMIHTPKGADQVKAAVLCLKYAKKYKGCSAANDASVEETYKKIYNKYLKFSVSQILHVCKLDSENYGEVLLQPNELIDMLYMHKDIVRGANAVILSCPDINKAVDDIASIYNIDILQKRKDLLEMFLSGNNIPIMYAYKNATEDMESVNLKRAAYICQSGELQYWQKQLVTMGIEEEVQLSMRVRANALKCLTMISDIESIEAITDLQYNAFINYIHKLYLLSDLEHRGFSMTLDELNNYNKKGLLRRLAQDMHYPATVKIMGDMCMVYSIYDTKYWNRIIDMSVKLNLFLDLKKYINFWSTICESKYKTFYIKAWQHVIDHSFSVFPSTKESEVFDCCVKNILMIQSCPVLHSLNFEKVFNKLCQMDRHDFAAVIIQYMPVANHNNLVSEILNNITELPDFSPLRECGICGIDLVNNMLKQGRIS